MSTKNGIARVKPRVVGTRGPRLSAHMPMRGERKEGRIRGRKMRPLPREVQAKRWRVRRGRMASQAVRRVDWVRVQKRAASRRWVVKRVRIGWRDGGGRGVVLRVAAKGSCL